MSDPTILPFVRQKANSADEYWFMTKQLMEEEEKGTVISRTIISDFGQPIGTINLFDVDRWSRIFRHLDWQFVSRSRLQ